MQCPVCLLENQSNAIRCDCGYEFVTSSKDAHKPSVHRPFGAYHQADSGLVVCSFRDFRTNHVLSVGDEPLTVRDM